MTPIERNFNEYKLQMHIIITVCNCDIKFIYYQVTKKDTEMFRVNSHELRADSS